MMRPMTDGDLLLATLRTQLGHWGVSPAARLSLLDISENTTFLVEDETRRLVLRVYRLGYHDAGEIAAELDWICHLRAAGVVETPSPLPGRDGRLLQRVPFAGADRIVAAFDWAPGGPPAPDAPLFLRLGQVAAALHGHARAWAPARTLRRKRWTVSTSIGPDGHWGDWRAGLGLDGQGACPLARAAKAVDRALARYGAGRDRFGLIHGDLRLTNLLAEDDRMTVIDFDDCGFGWFMYDFAAAVSFFEHDPIVPELAAAWAEGYRRVAPLTAEDEAVLPALVLMRRILLVAWVASHGEAPTAQAMGAGYTMGALTMAHAFLTKHS
jgi:Ser/Thr protein kinase RdoA (MazF antagonist)